MLATGQLEHRRLAGVQPRVRQVQGQHARQHFEQGPQDP
jgi:hypothetical protein